MRWHKTHESMFRFFFFFSFIILLHLVALLHPLICIVYHEYEINILLLLFTPDFRNVRHHSTIRGRLISSHSYKTCSECTGGW